jgi:hypothetical protein
MNSTAKDVNGELPVRSFLLNERVGDVEQHAACSAISEPPEFIPEVIRD